MSDKNIARRARAIVTFDGVDITEDIEKYLISITYTDNEEDQADDLQINIHDRENVWSEDWMAEMVEAAAANPEAASKEVTTQYKVTSSDGLYCRANAGQRYDANDLFPSGGSVDVYAIYDGWAIINNNGKIGYSNASYLAAATEEEAKTVSECGYGSSGDSVKECQQMLKALGYDLGDYGADGDYGSLTQAAVTQFQRDHGVEPVDGICGPLTFGALYLATDPNAIQNDPEMQDASKGMTIAATIQRQNWNGDGVDEDMKAGNFELDSIKVSGPPATITLKGTSAFYKGAIRQTSRTKAWEEYNLSGIAGEIAGRGGLSLQFDSKTDPFYSRVEQIKQTDLSFLVDLVHRAGISLKIYDGQLILFDQEDYERRNPVRTFTRGDGTYEKWDLETGEADSQYGSCRVYYKDPKKGEVYTGTVSAGNDSSECLTIYEKVSSNGEARALAAKMLRLKNKYETAVKMTIPGDPAMVAGVTVKMEGWGMFDGKYIIKQSKHTLSRSGYSTQITCRKVL